MGATEDWIIPSGSALLLSAGAGVCLLLAYTAIILALRGAALSVTAPFRYTIVLWAVLLGIAFWGDRPDALTIGGGLLIVGSGVFTLYREQKLGRAVRQETSIGGARP